MRSDLFKLPETPPSQPIDAGLGFSLCINEEWAKYVRALLVHLLDSRWELSKRDYAEQEVLRLLGKLNSEDNYGLLSCAPPTDPSTLVGEICQTYLPNSPRFEYELYNPFDPSARVPDGYTRAPMVHGRDYVTRFSDDAYNYGNIEDTDVLVSPDAVIENIFSGSFLDITGTLQTVYDLVQNGLPRVRFKFEGKGRLIFYFINAPQAGMAYLTMNGNPIPVNTADLSSLNLVDFESYSSIFATIFDFRPGNIHKQELLEVISDSEGDNYIDITFIPYIGKERGLGFGGGLRKVMFCQQLGGSIDDVGITKIEIKDCKLRTLSNATDWYAEGAVIEELDLPCCDGCQSSDCGDCGDCGCNDSNEDCGCCDDDCNDCGCQGDDMAIKDIVVRDGYLWKVNCNGSEERLMPLSGGDADIAHEIGASADISVIKAGIESATGQTLTGTPKISCVKATRLVEALRVRVSQGLFDGSSEPDPYATLDGDTGGWHIGGALTNLPSALGYMFTGGDQAANAAGYNDTALWDDLTCTLTQALTADFALTEIDIEITKQVLENHENDYISKAVNYVWDASQKSFFKEQVMIALFNPDAPCNCTSLYASGSGDIDLSTYEPQVAVDEWFIYPLTFEATSPVDDGSFWLGAKFEFPATSYGIWGVKFSIQNGGANTVVRRRNDASSNAQLWNDQSENLSNGVYWLIHADGFSALSAFGTRLTNPAYPNATDAPEIAAGTASAMQVDFSPDTGAENSVVYDVQLIGVKK